MPSAEVEETGATSVLEIPTRSFDNFQNFQKVPVLL